MNPIASELYKCGVFNFICVWCRSISGFVRVVASNWKKIKNVLEGIVLKILWKYRSIGRSRLVPTHIWGWCLYATPCLLISGGWSHLWVGAHRKIDVLKVGALNLHYDKKSFSGFSLGTVSNKVTKVMRTIIFLEVTKIRFSCQFWKNLMQCQPLFWVLFLTL